MNSSLAEHDLQLSWEEEFYEDFRVTQEIREKANEEFRFTQVSGGQWETWLEREYEDRARLELNHVAAFLRRTYTQYTQNRTMTNYSPSDQSTTDETAELMDGLLRRDVQREGGQDSLDTAVHEGMACGMGAVHLTTNYEDEGDPENDYQNIIFSELANSYSIVVFDAASKRADKSDAKHCTIIQPYTFKEYEQKYPNHRIASLTVVDRSQFSWLDNTQNIINVGIRYEVKEDKVELLTYTNPKNGEIVKIKREELEDNEDDLNILGYKLVRTRTVTKKSIYRSEFSGLDILEPQRRIVGQHIPVIPCYGYRRHVDGSEHFSGIVREHMDPQRVANMTFSLLAETAAHSSESKMVVTPQQMQNPITRAQWAENYHQKPYLLLDPVEDSAGNQMPLQPVIIPGTSISPALGTAIEMSNSSLQTSLGGAPQDTVDSNSSGKLFNAITKRVDMNTAPVFDNIDKFYKRIGVVYQSMASEVYGNVVNKGRMVRTIDDKGEASPVTLLERGAIDGSITNINDVSSGKFEVVVGVGKNYQTQREEQFEALKDLISIIPNEDPSRADYIKSAILMMDGSGMDDIQDSIRKELIIKGLMKPKTEEDIQMLQQLQQQPQQPDPNSVYLMAAAEKEASQAQLNEAKTAQAMGDAAKKAAETKETIVDTQIKTMEARQAVAQQA